MSLSFVGNTDSFIARSNKRKSIDYCRCVNQQIHRVTDNCLKAIYNQKVINFSKKRFGKAICFNCQNHQDESEVEHGND